MYQQWGAFAGDTLHQLPEQERSRSEAVVVTLRKEPLFNNQ
jgi:hypothetical protein